MIEDDVKPIQDVKDLKYKDLESLNAALIKRSDKFNPGVVGDIEAIDLRQVAEVRSPPPIRIGTIGHVGHGKRTLAGSLTANVGLTQAMMQLNKLATDTKESFSQESVETNKVVLAIDDGVQGLSPLEEKILKTLTDNNMTVVLSSRKERDKIRKVIKEEEDKILRASHRRYGDKFRALRDNALKYHNSEGALNIRNLNKDPDYVRPTKAQKKAEKKARHKNK